MTTPIGSVGALGAAGATGATGATSSSAAKSATAGKELGKDTFLKLLVAQLKYQDPSHPADGTEFLAQTAQFSMVEKLTDLSTSQQSLVTTQQMLAASSLIGRTVTFNGSDGIASTGVVSSASFSNGTATLRVGNTDVPLSSVTQVRNTAG